MSIHGNGWRFGALWVPWPHLDTLREVDRAEADKASKKERCGPARTFYGSKPTDDGERWCHIKAKRRPVIVLYSFINKDDSRSGIVLKSTTVKPGCAHDYLRFDKITNNQAFASGSCSYIEMFARKIALLKFDLRDLAECEPEVCQAVSRNIRDNKVRGERVAEDLIVEFMKQRGSPTVVMSPIGT